jgi:hypothetical protein
MTLTLLRCGLLCCAVPLCAGVVKQVNENGKNMWGMLTAEDFQPILEFDFLGPDSWGAAGRGEAEVAGMGMADKLELRARQVGALPAGSGAGGMPG